MKCVLFYFRAKENLLRKSFKDFPLFLGILSPASCTIYAERPVKPQSEQRAATAFTFLLIVFVQTNQTKKDRKNK